LKYFIFTAKPARRPFYHKVASFCSKKIGAPPILLSAFGLQPAQYGRAPVMRPNAAENRAFYLTRFVLVFRRQAKRKRAQQT
jgi:hypothetical protein